MEGQCTGKAVRCQLCLHWACWHRVGAALALSHAFARLCLPTLKRGGESVLCSGTLGASYCVPGLVEPWERSKPHVHHAYQSFAMLLNRSHVLHLTVERCCRALHMHVAGKHFHYCDDCYDCCNECPGSKSLHITGKSCLQSTNKL